MIGRKLFRTFNSDAVIPIVMQIDEWCTECKAYIPVRWRPCVSGGAASGVVGVLGPGHRSGTSEGGGGACVVAAPAGRAVGNLRDGSWAGGACGRRSGGAGGRAGWVSSVMGPRLGPAFRVC